MPAYFDNNATTRVDDRVVEAMLPFYSEHYGNASSRNHIYGRYAADAVDRSRQICAQWLARTKEEIIFTSGATESLNMAILGVARRYSSKGRRIVTIATEHKAVLGACEHLSNNGFEVIRVPVEPNGIVDISHLENSVNSDTILVCGMLANNETGVLQPVNEICAIAHKHNALFLCDATQAPGKLDFDRANFQADLLCLSAHKFYGPKGVGLLFFRRKKPRVALDPLMFGGGHERMLRSGTLNVPGIVGMAKALEVITSEEIKRVERLRNRLETAIVSSGFATVNGDKASRTANVSNLLFRGTLADEIIAATASTVAVSSGAACSSAEPEPSHVLLSMGLSDWDARCSIRFSLGRFNTAKEVEDVILVISNYLARDTFR